jgi:hypothetical protein
MGIASTNVDRQGIDLDLGRESRYTCPRSGGIHAEVHHLLLTKLTRLRATRIPSAPRTAPVRLTSVTDPNAIPEPRMPPCFAFLKI